MPGFINIQRDIEWHWIWLDPRRFQWWLQLLFMAAWEDKSVTFGNETIELKRGQIATTIRSLMKRWGAHSQATMSFLQVLENENMITRESTSKMTLITIVNYDIYQSETGQISNSPKRKSKQKPLQTKEERKQEKINTPLSSPSSRETETKLFEDLFFQQIFWEETAMSLQSTIPVLRNLAERFRAETLAKEKFHNNLQDLKTHFINWARLALRNEATPKKINLTNGTTATNRSLHQSAEERGAEFAQRICTKLASPDNPEPDISGNY